MKLAEFIRLNMEPILGQWEAFAHDLPPCSDMAADELRDHAEHILEAVCRDIVVAQTEDEQILKSKGLAKPLDARETAAQTHAFLRARAGFDISQMVSEYRALRACVLRLWAGACAPLHPDLQDSIRFNEAMDQAVAESVLCFSQEVDRARDLLLGALGHDMRNPLNAIQLTAFHLKSLNAGDAVSSAAERLVRSGGRMKALLDDLTDFNRTRLGLGIAVTPAWTDLATVFEQELDLLRSAFPDLQVELEVSGDVTGMWDADRIHQVVGNLVQNALRYGKEARPVRVSLDGLDGEVVFSVVNEGEPLSAEALSQMFEPLFRGADLPPVQRSLGLGLYVSRQIALAHSGSIDASSNDDRTSFTVRLPRRVHQPRGGRRDESNDSGDRQSAATVSSKASPSTGLARKAS